MSYFTSVAHEEGWLGSVVRTLQGDFAFFKLMAIELAQLADTIPITVDPVMKESLENRVHEIKRTLEIRRGRQEDIIRDAVDRLDTTEALRQDMNRRTREAAMNRRTTAQEALRRIAVDLDPKPQPPPPSFLSQPNPNI